MFRDSRARQQCPVSLNSGRGLRNFRIKFRGLARPALSIQQQRGAGLFHSTEVSVQKQHRLRKNSQFQHVYRKGRSVGARELAVVYLPSGRQLVGFSVGKKVGNAVTRNLVKRRLRAAFREEMPGLKKGLYIVAARSGASEADYRTLHRSLCYVLKKHQLYLNQT